MSETTPPAADPAEQPESAPEPDLLPEVPSEALLKVPAPALVPASVVTEIKPAYPREARRRNWEGVVEILVEVGADGQWRGGRVTASSGHVLLDEAALGALKGAAFRPATRDGAAEAATLTVRVTFVLKDAKKS